MSDTNAFAAILRNFARFGTYLEKYQYCLPASNIVSISLRPANVFLLHYFDLIDQLICVVLKSGSVFSCILNQMEK